MLDRLEQVLIVCLLSSSLLIFTFCFTIRDFTALRVLLYLTWRVIRRRCHILQANRNFWISLHRLEVQCAIDASFWMLLRECALCHHILRLNKIVSCRPLLSLLAIQLICDFWEAFLCLVAVFLSLILIVVAVEQIFHAWHQAIHLIAYVDQVILGPATALFFALIFRLRRRSRRRILSLTAKPVISEHLGARERLQELAACI